MFPCLNSLRVVLYGGVKEAPNVSVEYQASDQILSFYVALESLPSSWIAAVFKCQLTFNKRFLRRVSMGLTDRRKTAQNLVDSRKNWKNLTVSRNEDKKS